MLPTEWLAAAFEDLTDEIVALSPSEWAEENRRLPAGTPLPGPYEYSVTPYLREIADCLDSRSPVREVAIMKGAQTGGTVGVGENALGYWIGHQKTSPVMLVTATKELASLRIDEYIMPMIDQSGLAGMIQSSSETNKRKAGATAKKISWYGGGFLVPTGAREAANLRSVSIKNLFLDELDSYPIRVGTDGDPVALAKSRTKAFAKSRKVLMISTPTTDEQSRILQEYNAGDRRVYMVPCLGCDVYQEIRWQHQDRDGNQTGGIVWALDEQGNVKPGSVAYACPHCGHCHSNENKRTMLPRGRWEATAIPKHPSMRSYHISGLISPADFYSWEDAVVDWLEAWNVETKAPRDVEKLQTFYNNVLGKPYRISGARLTLAKVGRHVREFHMGRVPNALAMGMCEAKIGFLTCAADVQKDFLSAAVYAWGPGRVGFLVGRYVFEGATDDPFDENGPWGRLSELIDTKFSDGDGREYPITLTLVDSGYQTSIVYSFCGQYESAVYPLKGDDSVRKGVGREFNRMADASRIGGDGWMVNVGHYKTRLAAVLRATPRGDNEPALVDSVSFPTDLPDDALKEIIGEEYIQVGKKWEWKRVASRNELWDLTVYNSAARDIVAYMVCREHFELDVVNWSQFWPFADSVGFGWADSAPLAKT